MVESIPVAILPSCQDMKNITFYYYTIPTGSEERAVLGIGSIPGAIYTSLSSRCDNYCIIIAQT